MRKETVSVSSLPGGLWRLRTATDKEREDEGREGGQSREGIHRRREGGQRKEGIY